MFRPDVAQRFHDREKIANAERGLDRDHATLAAHGTNLHPRGILAAMQTVVSNQRGGISPENQLADARDRLTRRDLQIARHGFQRGHVAQNLVLRPAPYVLPSMHARKHAFPAYCLAHAHVFADRPVADAAFLQLQQK